LPLRPAQRWVVQAFIGFVCTWLTHPTKATDSFKSLAISILRCTLFIEAVLGLDPCAIWEAFDAPVSSRIDYGLTAVWCDGYLTSRERNVKACMRYRPRRTRAELNQGSWRPNLLVPVVEPLERDEQTRVLALWAPYQANVERTSAVPAEETGRRQYQALVAFSWTEDPDLPGRVETLYSAAGYRPTFEALYATEATVSSVLNSVILAGSVLERFPHAVPERRQRDVLMNGFAEASLTDNRLLPPRDLTTSPSRLTQAQ